ncbi:helix-turn-helix domain-containing protein [Nonomuraea sp. NPDC050790]|uniref:helix-turn-helix domain-containing protein n=1 Tax=Nonomuraea sp. NPDC050790 TaxID=3364371 RepID=UPI0037AAE248
MTTVHEWTGLEARALRLALRMSVPVFAQHLGVAPRTVAGVRGVDSEIEPDTEETAVASCE